MDCMSVRSCFSFSEKGFVREVFRITLLQNIGKWNCRTQNTYANTTSRYPTFQAINCPFRIFFSIFAHSKYYIVCENYATLQLSPT